MRFLQLRFFILSPYFVFFTLFIFFLHFSHLAISLQWAVKNNRYTWNQQRENMHEGMKIEPMGSWRSFYINYQTKKFPFVRYNILDASGIIFHLFMSASTFSSTPVPPLSFPDLVPTPSSLAPSVPYISNLKLH